MALKSLQTRIGTMLGRRPPSEREALLSSKSVDEGKGQRACNRNSKISSWTTVTKSAMSLEEFSEYFVARVVRDDFPRGIGTEYKDIGINIVQAICALHTPRMYYTQVGEFDIQLRIDHAGFCIPAPKGAISEIYVLSAHHTSDAEWKGYQKWLENVRKQKPLSPIIIIQSHVKDNAWISRPAPNQRAIPNACAELATIIMNGTLIDDDVIKVLSKCAILEFLENRSSRLCPRGSEKQVTSGGFTIPSYTYKTIMCADDMVDEPSKVVEWPKEELTANLVETPPSYAAVASESQPFTLVTPLTGWVGKTKTAISCEQFSDYFVETLVREKALLHEFNTTKEALNVNLVMGIWSKYYPGLLDVQIGKRSCHIQHDPTGYCLPHMKKPRIHVYVLFLQSNTGMGSNEYLRWLQGARKTSPCSPIILFRCHTVDGVEKPGPDPTITGTLNQSLLDLATIYMDAILADKDKVLKVVTRCAMLMSMEGMGHVPAFTEAGLNDDPRINPIPEYTFKKQMNFADC